MSRSWTTAVGLVMVLGALAAGLASVALLPVGEPDAVRCDRSRGVCSTDAGPFALSDLRGARVEEEGGRQRLVLDLGARRITTGWTGSDLSSAADAIGEFRSGSDARLVAPIGEAPRRRVPWVPLIAVAALGLAVLRRHLRAEITVHERTWSASASAALRHAELPVEPREPRAPAPERRKPKEKPAPWYAPDWMRQFRTPPGRRRRWWRNH